jgi:hypothetical protein
MIQVRLLLYLLDLVARKAPPISPSAEKMGLTLSGPESKIANDLRSSVAREDTPQPANSRRGYSIQSTFALPLKSLGSPSKHRCFERRLERDFCTQHLGKDNRACQNSPMIVDHVLPLLIPLSHLAQHDKESFPSTVLDHDSNLNNTQCRISYTGSTVAKVSSLHCPSKNGTSRPLRPPCLFPGSRFEHHLITLFEKDPQPPFTTPQILHLRQDEFHKSSKTGEKSTTRRLLSFCVCSDTPGRKVVMAGLTYSHNSLLTQYALVVKGLF